MADVTERDWRPRYVQVAEALRDKILSGELAAGTAMPSEHVLSDTYGLSRTSVRNAIKQLRDWGLVRAEQGRGTYVRSPRQRVIRNHTERYQWEKNRARLPEEERRRTGATEFDTGLEMPALNFRVQYHMVSADAQLAEVFDIPEGTQLLKREYWTSSRAENTPLNLVRSYLMYEVAAKNEDLLDESKEPWPGGTQHQLYTLGIELDQIVDRLTARPPLPEEAEALGIEPGVSVLVLHKTSIDIHGRTVEFSEVVMPGDRTEVLHVTRLERWAD
ncbi:GntR family transcriptional regulator [Microbispora sp. NBC_01189]|uniref:GntR family transcriptional regulator n=1 Tax=Microbispora sp. NBC_01189 TaxID=2903583 RepID=UPI002E140929|nr:GntR family transcriptional regulator [Microbispora sp. NBC_01189]